MNDNEARKRQLLNEIAAGTTNQNVYDELMQLNQALEKAVQERQSRVEDVKTMIREYGIALMEVRDAFSASELRAAGVARPAGARKGAKRTSRRAGEVLIADVKTASGKGAASNYHQGQKPPQYVPKAFKEMFEANPDNFEAALQSHFTAAGKAYFATEAGKNELADWIDFVKTKNVSKRPG